MVQYAIAKLGTLIKIHVLELVWLSYCCENPD
jgi:hypothetical protein